jgi:outer membrane lipase/esterase
MGETRIVPAPQSVGIQELFPNPLGGPEQRLAPSLSERTDRVAGAVFTSIAVFGDSLSDPGNASSLWHKETPPPYDTLDSLSISPYPYSLSHRYCNGPTWIELFAKKAGVEPCALAAFSDQAGGHLNFAVGRARARNTGNPAFFDLPAQVERFLSKTQGQDLSGTLFALEIGANDVRDALSEAGEQSTPIKIVKRAIGSIDEQVKRLYERGARKFLVWTIPDIGKTPALQSIDTQNPGTARAAGGLTTYFNTALKTHLKAFSTLPGIAIFELDAHKKLDDMAAFPSKYGLRNVRASFLPASVGNPDEYLFWDGIHGTERFQEAIAQEAALVMGMPVA